MIRSLKHIRRMKPDASVHGLSSLCLALGLLLLSGQRALAQNHVLELDGDGSYVVLPPNTFTNLTESTVEVWAKWDGFRAYSGIFEFGGADKSMLLLNHSTSSDLRFNLYPQFGADDPIRVNSLLRTNEWIHLAALSGPGGMKLYANGMQVGEHTNAASFADMKISRTNLIGRALILNPTRPRDFHGQMDELRVWTHRRTEKQIRENMFKKLTGAEPGLAGLWNFDNVDNGFVKDGTSGAHHGQLIGNAKTLEALLPASPELNLPGVLFGKVTDRAGNPMTNATVRVLRQERVISTATSRPDGSYSIVVRTENDTCDIEASAGELGVWVMGVTCPRGERKEANLTLSNAVSIAGKVTAFDGSLIPDVVVQVLRADAAPREPGKLSTPGLVQTTATANATPGYRFVNLAPGAYKVRIHLPDSHLYHNDGQPVEIKTSETKQIDFQIAPFHKGQWRRYGTDKGLPSNDTRDLQFAADGMLWIATPNGIARFDGREFVRFTQRDGLIDNRAFCIHAAVDGTLWFGTQTGASRFDPKTGRFQNFPSGQDGLTAGPVFDIEATPDGTIWLRTFEGLSRYDGQSFYEFPGVLRVVGLSDWFNNYSKILAVDRTGRLWLAGGPQGLKRLSGTNLVRFGVNDGLSGGEYAEALHVSRDGSVWFRSFDAANNLGDTTVSRYDPKGFQNLMPMEGQTRLVTRAIHETSDGILWFGHVQGDVTRYNPQNHSFVRFSRDQTRINATVIQIASHSDGSIWFATQNGIYRYQEHTFVNYGKPDGLPGEFIMASAAARDGSIWFAGGGGTEITEPGYSIDDSTPNR